MIMTDITLYYERLRSYQRMINCPSQTKLFYFQWDKLPMELIDEVKEHLSHCQWCQQDIKDAPELPNTIPPFPIKEPVALPETDETKAIKPGQIWQIKSKFNFHQKDVLIEVNFKSFWLVIDEPVSHLSFETVNACPISDMTILASDYDFVLHEHTKPFYEEIMVQLWAVRPVLTSHLKNKLIGTLPESVFKSIKEKIIKLESSKRPIISEHPEAQEYLDQFIAMEQAQLNEVDKALKLLEDLAS